MVLFIDQMNDVPLLQVVSNSVLLTSQECEFSVALHDVSKHHGEKQYIHDGDRIIPLNFDSVLIYVPIW